jgi:ATP-dependent DNA ligase
MRRSPGKLTSPTRRNGRTRALRSGKNAKPSRPYPDFIEPCHPVERDSPPSGGNWVHEIKADGYRAQVHVRDGKATVYSRRGYDGLKPLPPSRAPRGQSHLLSV